MLLYIALELKVLKVEDIKETSSFLIAITPIMFLPPAVGIVEPWGLVKGSETVLELVPYGSTTLRLTTFPVACK